MASWSDLTAGKMENDAGSNSLVPELLENKKREIEGLRGAIGGWQGSLEAKVAQLLPKQGASNLPDYDAINENSPRYKAEVADAVREAIKEIYTLDNELCPLKKGVDSNKMDSISFGMIENLYLQARDPLVNAVGKSGFGAILRETHKQATDMILENAIRSAVSGYDKEIHGLSVVQTLAEEYGAKIGELDIGKLTDESQKLVSAYLGGTLNKNMICDLGAKPKTGS